MFNLDLYQLSQLGMKYIRVASSRMSMNRKSIAQEVLSYLYEVKTASSDEIARGTGLKEGTVRGALTVLLKKGLVDEMIK